MSELSAGENNVDELVPLQYHDIGANVGRRWGVYKYAQPEEIDFHASAVKSLKLQGDEAVLDAGCGSGHLLFRMRQCNYPGQLIGLDLHENVFFPADLELEPGDDIPIDFIIGTAESLPFKDESIDVVLAMFMLYHTEDPEKATEDIRRVLKPGGQLAVATSGKGNKLRHREFEADIAEYLGIKAPPIFSSKFDSGIAENVLTQYFGHENVKHTVSQRNDIIIDNVDSYQAYLDSLDSMKNAFSPVPSYREWLAAIENVVHPVIQKQFEDEGFFADPVERDLFICTKPTG